MLRIILIIVVLQQATPIQPPARDVKIARMDWWRGARFAGTTISRTVRDSGDQFELLECFDLCLADTLCGAFWVRIDGSCMTVSEDEANMVDCNNDNDHAESAG